MSTFNPKQLWMTGSCEYIGGCMMPDADNFNWKEMITITEVVEFDGEPNVVPQDQAIYGCMDAAAQKHV